ncbi:MAG: ankyrin repeat domain-containing protein [Acidimicrobiales bacterium]
MDSKRRTLAAVLAAFALLLATGLLSVVGRTRPDLSEAVADGDYEQTRVLLNGGAEPDQPIVQGFTPLMRAAIRDDGPMVKLLVGAGAEIEARASAGGLTPLHTAAIADSPEAMQVLIDAGADLDVRSRSGRNALDHAAASGSVRAISVLSAAGIDVNAQSEAFVQIPGHPGDAGPTPLAIAARAGQLQAVETLLGLGANVDGQSKRGQTALLQALASGQSEEMITLLMDSGATPG